jgi:hypothetical protein
MLFFHRRDAKAPGSRSILFEFRISNFEFYVLRSSVFGLRSSVFRLPSSVFRSCSYIPPTPFKGGVGRHLLRTSVFRLRSSVFGLPSPVSLLPSPVSRLPSSYPITSLKFSLTISFKCLSTAGSFSGRPSSTSFTSRVSKMYSFPSLVCL